MVDAQKGLISEIFAEQIGIPLREHIIVGGYLSRVQLTSLGLTDLVAGHDGIHQILVIHIFQNDLLSILQFRFKQGTDRGIIHPAAYDLVAALRRIHTVVPDDIAFDLQRLGNKTGFPTRGIIPGYRLVDRRSVFIIDRFLEIQPIPVRLHGFQPLGLLPLDLRVVQVEVCGAQAAGLQVGNLILKEIDAAVQICNST